MWDIIICNYKLLLQINGYQTFIYRKLISIDILLAPLKIIFKGNASIDSPFWVIKDMFISSIIIYVSSLIKHQILDKQLWCIEIYLFIVSLFFILIDKPIIFSCIFGMSLNLEYFRCEKFIIHNKVYAVMAIIFIVLCYISNKSIMYCFGFALLVIIVPKSATLKHINESHLAQLLGKYSFGIYAIHWPIICSAGCWVLINYVHKVNNNVLAIMSLIVICFLYY